MCICRPGWEDTAGASQLPPTAIQEAKVSDFTQQKPKGSPPGQALQGLPHSAARHLASALPAPSSLRGSCDGVLATWRVCRDRQITVFGESPWLSASERTVTSWRGSLPPRGPPLCSDGNVIGSPLCSPVALHCAQNRVPAQRGALTPRTHLPSFELCPALPSLRHICSRLPGPTPELRCAAVWFLLPPDTLLPFLPPPAPPTARHSPDWGRLVTTGSWRSVSKYLLTDSHWETKGKLVTHEDKLGREELV